MRGKWWGCGGMGWDLPLFVVVVVVAAVGVLVLRVLFVRRCCHWR